MKKFAVTKTELDVIEGLITKGTWSKAELLAEHEMDSDWSNVTEAAAKVLNGMPVDKLAAILYIPEALEIQLTPKQHLDRLYTNPMDWPSEDAYCAFQIGLEQAAKVFGYEYSQTYGGFMPNEKDQSS